MASTFLMTIVLQLYYTCVPTNQWHRSPDILQSPIPYETNRDNIGRTTSTSVYEPHHAASLYRHHRQVQAASPLVFFSATFHPYHHAPQSTLCFDLCQPECAKVPLFLPSLLSRVLQHSSIPATLLLLLAPNEDQPNVNGPTLFYDDTTRAAHVIKVYWIRQHRYFASAISKS
jgi:hypothetical protein